MGSFNVTCSISNLPITWNEKVKVGFLVETPMYDMIRSCSKYRFLFPFLLDGVYDDYGRCKVEIGDSARHMIDEFIKKHAVIQENDDTITNTSDKLNRENLNLDTIYEYLHQGVLYFQQGDTYISRQSIKFSDVYSKEIPMDHPVKVFPFTIKKSLYDNILSGSYDPECPVFTNGELEYQSITFDEFKKSCFGSENEATLKSFFTHVMESMKLGSEPLDESLFIGSDEEKTELLEELNGILESIPRAAFMIVSMSTETRGDHELRASIERVIKSLSDDDESDGEINLPKLIDFFDRNKSKLDTSSSHRRVVYEYMNKVGSHDSGPKTALYTHIYKDFFENEEIPVDNFKDFYAFMLWVDNYINGTVTPSRYAGQDFNVRAYRMFFNACMKAVDDYENHDYDYYYDEDEDDEE